MGLLRRSEHSILRAQNWKPDLPREEPDTFTLTDLLRFAGVLRRSKGALTFFDSGGLGSRGSRSSTQPTPERLGNDGSNKLGLGKRLRKARMRPGIRRVSHL